ncbi:hypothetical protein JYQ62_11035 [Nostoc sp. UHCC 0702]|nr:hypothetical protein JYQ62_11035 [Nostoc sp. UHCC 0702]
MNSNQENTTSSKGSLRLPKPDQNNITVLAHNLPSKPILPWNRFDSPSLNKESNKIEQTSQQKSSATFNVVNYVGAIGAARVVSQIKSKNTDSITSIDEEQQNQETT